MRTTEFLVSSRSGLVEQSEQYRPAADGRLVVMLAFRHRPEGADYEADRAEIVGAIAVVGSLVYLAIQLRQNTPQLKLQGV
mgnify:CR=1 FL=1